jgi:uncharacterized protein YybS (DUF2232 family)
MSDSPVDGSEERPDADAEPLVNEGSDERDNFSPPQVKAVAPLRMVETAFLASTASLIWFINYYFPLGPVLRIFFPVPIALVYLRWGNRAAWMATLVSGLLLSVLMGPTRSILFVIPYGFMGVLLGAAWHRRSPWFVSIGLGTLLGVLGFFFRFWVLSVLSGEDLWVYTITQVTEFVQWVFVKLELLAVPSVLLIQALAIASVFASNIIYLFVVHLAAWLLLDRLGNPIPRPPNWVQVLMDYEG